MIAINWLRVRAALRRMLGLQIKPAKLHLVSQEPFPFRSHRTMAQVMADEARAGSAGDAA